MRIIDIHTHVYPDPIAQKATDSIKNFYELGGADMNGTVSMLCRRGAEAGITRYMPKRVLAFLTSCSQSAS